MELTELHSHSTVSPSCEASLKQSQGVAKYPKLTYYYVHPWRLAISGHNLSRNYIKFIWNMYKIDKYIQSYRILTVHWNDLIMLLLFINTVLSSVLYEVLLFSLIKINYGIVTHIYIFTKMNYYRLTSTIFS